MRQFILLALLSLTILPTSFATETTVKIPLFIDGSIFAGTSLSKMYKLNHDKPFAMETVNRLMAESKFQLAMQINELKNQDKDAKEISSIKEKIQMIERNFPMQTQLVVSQKSDVSSAMASLNNKLNETLKALGLEESQVFSESGPGELADKTYYTCFDGDFKDAISIMQNTMPDFYYSEQLNIFASNYKQNKEVYYDDLEAVAALEEDLKQDQEVFNTWNNASNYNLVLLYAVGDGGDDTNVAVIPSCTKQSTIDAFESISSMAEDYVSNGLSRVTGFNPYLFNIEEAKKSLNQELNIEYNQDYTGDERCNFKIASGIEASLKLLEDKYINGFDEDNAISKELTKLYQEGVIRNIAYAVYTDGGDSEYCSLNYFYVYSKDGSLLKLEYNHTD